MGKSLAKKISGISLRTKICIVFMLLVVGFLYQGLLKPLIGDTATNTYYFTLDSSTVNLGADGNTNTSRTLNGKISLKTGVYATSQRITGASNTTEQTMISAYGPAYASPQTVTAPAVTIGVRDGNGTANNITWKAYIYDYNPAGTAGNGTLLWTSNAIESHPSVQTPLALTFTNPQPKDNIAIGHRLKVVITCQMASTASSARLYWGGGTNYSFFTVTEAPYVANSVTVTNLSDYYGGKLTTVIQGDSNIPMLQFDLYSNVAGGVSWTGGKLDKIGTNSTLYITDPVNGDTPDDSSFYIYKDANGDGLFEPTDTLIGGPYNFSQLTGQAYTLTTAQTITSTPQRYFIVYNILKTATYNTTIGARIADSTYFTFATPPAGGVQNVTSTSSSTPNIQYGGVAITKTYPADWDNGTSLAGISEIGATQPSPNATDSACVTRNTVGSGFPLVGLLNYPGHSCTSVSGQGYSTTTAQADFIRLYFGGTGYPAIMKSIQGGTFIYQAYTPSGGGTVTLQLFYVTSGGVRVNAPTTATYTTTSSVTQTITTSLAGQDFTNVPAGARLGIQIGVTANMRIGLGSAVGAQLTVQETEAENENVDVGNGSTTANANVYASDTGKLIDSFTLTAAKAKTVNSITVTGNSMFNSTNIKNVRIYADAAPLGVFSGSETLIGSTTTITGNSATISGLSLAVGTTLKRFLVVVDISDTPNTNVVLTALVSNLTVATTGTIGVNSDNASSTLTILPTTTLSDHIAAEPANQTIPWNAGLTKVDAFGLKTNGGVNDTINDVTVALSTTSTLPAGKLISNYIGEVDIVNAAGTSLGKLTAPTIDDDWQITVTGLAATTTGTDYFVAITPKGNQNITFTVKAMVIAVAHSRLSNALLVSDTTSASITMDQQPPTEPTLTAVTGNYGADVDLAQINLSWLGSTDLGGGAVSYKLVRGLGSAPPPINCTTDGVKSFLVYQGTALSYINKGLDEGVSYGYRVCAVDSVGNTSAGSAKSATASIKNRCSELPSIAIDPMASYVKAGNSVAMGVSITNKDTGVCPPTTFTLSTIGTNVDDSNFAVATFAGNAFIIPTNNGSQYTTLNTTAKPGAAQGATKTFHVMVTKSSGGQTQCPDPIYVVVNKYGTMTHSSLQLGTKYGSWGLNYDCSTCHSPSSTNIKQVKNIISTPNGNRGVTFSITSTTSGANVAGVYGNDNRTGTASTNVCEVCHHNARFHQYSASKIAWTGHNNNKDCTKCHSHSIGFKSVATAGACDACHGYPPTTQSTLVSPPTNVLPYATNAGAHAKHNDRGLACKTCHSNGNHIDSAVPAGNKQLNMGFRINNSNFSGFVGNMSSATLRAVPPGNGYTWNGAAGLTIQQAPSTIMTCNVYCHGWPNNGGYNNEPAWTGISQVGCGSCHAATNDIPPTSGSHHKHASNDPGFGNGIACSRCHGYRNYSTSSAHINGKVEWDLSSINETIATYRGAQKGTTGAPAPTAPGTYGSCANLYCHSNVVQPNNNGVGAPTVFTNPTWGGTTNCNSCHPGQPNTTGGHPQHAGAGVTGFDCRICHAAGGDANPLNHANGQIDFKFVGLGENTHYSYSSAKITGSAPYGTCYNGNCHGSRRAKTGATALTWGPATATPLCDKCHSGSATAGGFYGTAGPNSTTSNADPYVGAHFKHITSVTFKHSAKIDCSQCHLKPTGPYSPGHIDTPLPAEITYGTLSKSGVQNGYTSAAHAPGYNFGTKQCSNVWCHGAGMNSNQGTGPYASVVYDGGTLGTPTVPVWNSPFLTGTSSDCTKCHSYPPPAPMSGYTHWDDNNNRPYIPNQCILCHKHVNATGDGFTNPALHVNGTVDSCNICHGRPPIDQAGLVVPDVGAVTTGLVGSHQAHILNPNIGKKCDVCHYNSSTDMPSYKLEIGFNGFGGKVSRGTFYGYTTLSANYTPQIVYFSTRTSTTVRRTKNVTNLNTCQNLYCHGGGTGILPALGGGSNTKPNWEIGSSQAVCGTCHGVTGATYKTRGSHGRHVGSGYGDVGLDCVNCHGIKANAYHVNGMVEWQFYSTALRLNQTKTTGYTGNIGYMSSGGSSFATSGNTGNLAPSASYGTCQVYCHSDVYSKTFKPVVWGSAPLNCGSCHNNQTSTFTGSHKKHSASSTNGGYGIDCLICHYGSGMGSALHVNGNVDIIFNPGVVGPNAQYVSATKNCFNILCHNTTASTGPTWGVSSTGNYDTGTYKPTCIGCHSGELNGRAAIIPQFAGQSHHIQGVTVSNSYCYPCHREALDTLGETDPAFHNRSSGRTVDLVIWSTGARGTAFTRYTANGSATRKRTEYAKVNNQCIGCHRSRNNAITPFSASGDNRTPKTYAWDNYAIFDRYSSKVTTPWGKVTGNNTPSKALNKAYSAHGNASANQRGWATGNAATGETYGDTSGSVSILCFDCHNSHGTYATGIMSSYSSATGRYQGAMLKSTTQNLGGYGATYIPTAGGSAAAPDNNAYNPGAALCFDCHNTASASTTIPWGYNSTFGATKGIFGYNDTPRFDNYTAFAATRTYPYKAGNATNKGGHFGHSSNLSTSITQRSFDIKPQAGATAINGLCSPCHDPHGVSPSLGANQAYAVPLLKGTWVTSPYKQDAAPANTNEARGGSSHNPTAAINIGSTPAYNIDQNSMQAASTGKPASAKYWTFPGTPSTLQSTNDTQFSGLCTGCHNKTGLNNTAAVTSAPGSTGSWKSMTRIHNTVDGWATATGGNANNSKHAFTCSKCHTVHNSQLPRLLVTNCLDARHRGRPAAGASTSAAPVAYGTKYSSGAGTGRFPMGGGGYASRGSSTNPGPWFFGKSQTSVVNAIPAITVTTQTQCHNSATAGGATYSHYSSQHWNKKSPW
ncbi:MAG TPA: CxxxxCH/CxxCH domain-containing protein [Desulfuromonadaceae bacterium]|jgi:predicted CxxxxCH...CXXCH cytochrome family protein